MNRRTFVTSVTLSATTLGGCVQRHDRTSPGGTNETPTDDGQDTDVETYKLDETNTTSDLPDRPENPPSVGIATPAELPLPGMTATVETTRDTFGTSDVPQLTVRLQNTADRTYTLTYTAKYGVNLISGSESVSDYRLLLIEGDPEYENRGCWWHGPFPRTPI